MKEDLCLCAALLHVRNDDDDDDDNYDSDVIVQYSIQSLLGNV